MDPHRPPACTPRGRNERRADLYIVWGFDNGLLPLDTKRLEGQRPATLAVSREFERNHPTHSVAASLLRMHMTQRNGESFEARKRIFPFALHYLARKDQV